MQDISDKELDQFFKNSIEHSDVTFEEDAWTKMEQSLKKHDQKQRVKSYRNRALLVLAVYILSAVSVRIVEHDASIDSSSLYNDKKTTPTSTTASSVNPLGERNTTVANETNAPAIKDIKELAFSTEQSSDKQIAWQQEKAETANHSASPTGNEGQKVRRERERERERETNKDEKASYADAYSEQVHARKHNKGEELVIVEKQQKPIHSLTSEKIDETFNSEHISPVAIDPDPIAFVAVESQTNSTALHPTQELKNTANADQSNNPTNTENSKNINTEENTGQTNALALTVDSTQKIIPTDSLLPVAAVTTKDSSLSKDKVTRKRHLSFGVFASPDFSFTASKEFVSPGLSEGFFVEYHYNKRFSVFAGLMHSSKIYSSSASDYNATDKYWGYKGYTSRIDGSCAVLDVPVNIKYHFYNQDKTLLFAAAGMSSYFMLHEQYSFIYKDGSPERSWEHTKKQNYFFGLVNVSIGYEHYISKSFSVQVEPFIKIPINTIGLGEVKLLTTGMFVYLKYSIK